MRNKTLALVIAFLITMTALAITLYISRGEKTAVKGLATTSGISTEHQSERLPQSKVNVDSLLVTLGKSAGLTIIEIVDTTFVWQAPGNNYEVLGKGVVIDNASSDTFNRIVSKLKEAGFIQSSQNTYLLDHKNNYGFQLEDNACLVRAQEVENKTNNTTSFSTKTEVRCGLIDYSRTKNSVN